MRKLKLFNGVAHGSKHKNQKLYVAASSMKRCAELASKASGTFITQYDVSIYWSKGSWGTAMNGIEASEPCVYVIDKETKTPKRVL